MIKNKFTIIIPTRNRADVLKWALKTCTMQDYDNLEIIISDNYSEDDTREVVQSFDDNRIKYFNTGRRLSMSHNWEYALSKASGGYISILGDDDGFLPNALENINDILQNHPLEAIAWHQSRYCWPGSGFHSHSLFVNMRHGVRIYNGQENLTRVLNYINYYTTNPWLYAGFIKHGLLTSIQKKSSGSFFHSRIPDIYSGIAIASQVGKYVYSTGPFSMAGISSHSNGASSFTSNEKLRKAFNLFMNEAELLPFHPSLEFIASSIPLLIAESAFQARDLGLIDKNMLPNLNYILRVCVDTALSKEQSVKEHEISRLKEIAQKHDINWDELYQDTNKKPQKNLLKTMMKQKLMGVTVDGDKANLHNVYEASLFHEKIYSTKSKLLYNMVRRVSELIHGNT
jgi:hypothetical protein